MHWLHCVLPDALHDGVVHEATLVRNSLPSSSPIQYARLVR